MDIKAFWDAVLRQDAGAIREYFHPDAWVNWHNTNEHFTVEEFIRANCEYPGEWDGDVEQIITTDTHIITATHVFSNLDNASVLFCFPYKKPPAVDISILPQEAFLFNVRF